VDVELGSRLPAEQRVLAALYTACGVAFMVLVVWHQLDPEGPHEWWARMRERAAAWRRERAELLEQLEEIHELPETERREPCEGS